VVRANKLPWWQVTKTARAGFIVGSFWLLIFLGHVVSGIVSGDWPWYDVLVNVGFALGSVAYFGSAIALVKSGSRRAEPPTR
jgi:hypothetical protein